MSLGIKTHAEFAALPLEDQEFWLAYQTHRERELRRLIKNITGQKYTDVGGLVTLLTQVL